MCNFQENANELLEPALGIGVDRGHDVVGHQYNLFNLPQKDDVVSQYAQNVQPPCAENVVHDKGVRSP